MHTKTKHELILNFLEGTTSTQENCELYHLLQSDGDEEFDALCRTIWDDTGSDALPDSLASPPGLPPEP